MSKLSIVIVGSVLTSLGANAGYILPELGRSQLIQNASPVAVGLSERKLVSLNYEHDNLTTNNNGVEYSKDTDNEFGGRFDYAYQNFKTELDGSYTKAKSDYSNPSISGSNHSIYSLEGSFAAIFNDSFVAGINLKNVKVIDNLSISKDETKTTNVVPALGFKFNESMAVGFGMNHETQSGTNQTSLSSSSLFAGVAYGVSRKIGADGFGVEAVVNYQPKEKDTNGSSTLEVGKKTAIFINGGFTQGMFDLTYMAMMDFGKSYDEKNTVTSQMISLFPEFMVASPIYVSPILSYSYSKNKSEITGLDSTTTDTKTTLLGLGVGYRQNNIDGNIYYMHQSSKNDSSNLELKGNQIVVNLTFNL
jgi:hypothetical protein